MATEVMELRSLTKFYGQHRGIEDLTLSVEEGEILGFIGPNGAGKSTTIRTLLALIYPTSGSARIFGKDCIQNAPEIARDVGYVPSETFYYERMTVMDLLKYAEALYQKDCTKRIYELSERLNLDLTRRIADLSLGNKKKVGIVQGLLHSPRLLLLDEPTSGLDPLMQQTFFEILREENAKGVTVFFSSHVLSEVQKMCGRVAILKEGRLLTVEKIDRLRNDGVKKIHMETREPVQPSLFELDGITSLTQNGLQASFLYRGDVGEMLLRLGRLPINDITIEEPTLEEIFLHYYK